MAFTTAQVRKLAGKLPERFVKTRTERGVTLSYVEGWHVIDEANRVFGFDGWDRETISAECVWQDGRISPKACSYAVRVRIKVRAGKIIVSREGTGIGHGTGATLGEAHESALKEAETDATKRALTTFGNLFGLALYDKDQAGVQRAKGPAADVAPVAWTLARSGQPPQPFPSPHQFCSAAKEALRQAASVAELEALWTANAPVVAQLVAVRPELRTRNGTHYADLLETLFRQKRSALADSARERSAAVEAPEPPIAKIGPTMQPSTAVPTDLPAAIALPSEPPPVVPLIGTADGALTMPRRIRDGAHLKYIASLPCLVCGRTPSHAHHLRFAQLRSLGSKPSDEWTVPLCPIHHRALHDAGREDEWWPAKGIDAKAEAERLWRTTHPATAAAAAALAPSVEIEPMPHNTDGGGNRPSPAASATGPKPPPIDSQGQPFPINRQAGSADRS